MCVRKGCTRRTNTAAADKRKHIIKNRIKTFFFFGIPSQKIQYTYTGKRAEKNVLLNVYSQELFDGVVAL